VGWRIHAGNPNTHVVASPGHIVIYTFLASFPSVDAENDRRWVANEFRVVVVTVS